MPPALRLAAAVTAAAALLLFANRRPQREPVVLAYPVAEVNRWREAFKRSMFVRERVREGARREDVREVR